MLVSLTKIAAEIFGIHSARKKLSLDNCSDFDLGTKRIYLRTPTPHCYVKQTIYTNALVIRTT